MHIDKNTNTYAKLTHTAVMKDGYVREGVTLRIGSSDDVEHLSWDHNQDFFVPIISDEKVVNNRIVTTHYLRRDDLKPIERTMLLPVSVETNGH